MSSEKKNAGRDPVALTGDPPATRLVRKFLEMQEVDYMRNVVIPVLEAEGYSHVDYHHGPNEIGKDLIFFKEEPFGRQTTAVAVVKSDRLTKSSSDPNGLPVFLIQVQQASQNEILCWDGLRRSPDEVLVIFADDPSHDILNSNPGGFLAITKARVNFVRGSDVAVSLLKHRQDIAEQILESRLDATAFLNCNPTNRPLLLALHNDDIVNLHTIFTDLDASVGGTTFRYALSLRASEKPEAYVPLKNWVDASEALTLIECSIGKVLTKSIDDIQLQYQSDAELANSPRNLELWKTIQKTLDELQSWSQSITIGLSNNASSLTTGLKQSVGISDSKTTSEIYDIISSPKEDFNELFCAVSQFNVNGNIDFQVVDLNHKFDNCVEAIASALEELKVIESSADLNQLIGNTLATTIRDLERDNKDGIDLKQTVSRLVKNAKLYVKPPQYQIKLDSAKFNGLLQEKMDRLLLDFRSEQIVESRDFAKQVLNDARALLTSISCLSAQPSLSTLVTPTPNSQSDEYLGACILGLLSSGIDVLLTGDAGFGKSTTLEMFARKCVENLNENDQAIFVPLSKLSTTLEATDKTNFIEEFSLEAARLFSTVQAGLTPKIISGRILNSQKLIILLDGIDEAVNLKDWLLGLISSLRKLKGNSVQIVASSRFDVPKLEEFGFLKIELLPFRRDQVIRFVKTFLADSPELAEHVITHLQENPTMFSVAQTPLMATILCVLAKNGVVLPETKIALYRERFELLWGAYDAKKQVNRVSSARACLEDASKKAAYFLHSRRWRTASADKILESLQDSLSRKYNKNVISQAFDDLINPCNILLKDHRGNLGFGHLAYQEYLVAEELYTNRQTEIVTHLSDPWWKEVLVLVAMKTDDLGTLIEKQIIDYGEIGPATETLHAMISVAPPGQRRHLTKLLSNHRRLDSIPVDNFWDDQ